MTFFATKTTKIVFFLYFYCHLMQISLFLGFLGCTNCSWALVYAFLLFIKQFELLNLVFRVAPLIYMKDVKTWQQVL